MAARREVVIERTPQGMREQFAIAEDVAMTVQIRSSQRYPPLLLLPWVTLRSFTTNRIQRSARLLVGSKPSVVRNFT